MHSQDQNPIKTNPIITDQAHRVMLLHHYSPSPKYPVALGPPLSSACGVTRPHSKRFLEGEPVVSRAQTHNDFCGNCFNRKASQFRCAFSQYHC